jgi:uncharacterized cupredoxin-like copper-binding protein
MWAIIVVVATVVLSGCSSAADLYGPGMMGAGQRSALIGSGGSDYHPSHLTCSAPTSLPGSTVTVVLADMGMTHMASGTAPLRVHMMLRASRTTVPAGQISLVAVNMGWRTHELVILPLAATAEAGQRIPGPDGKVDETASRGEASASCADGAGDGIRSGAVGWITVTLTPGRYEFLCNPKNHYADGMHQVLVAT